MLLHSYSEIRTHVAPLLDLASEISGAPRGSVESLCDTLLAPCLPAEGEPIGRSSINSDGSPLQLVLSAFGGAWRTRLLGDPASLVADPLQRARASRPALQRALHHTESAALEPLADATWRMLLPQDEVTLRRHVEGVCWLGGGVGMPGLAVYFDATRGSEDERWNRLRDWLRAVLPAADRAEETLAALRPHADLMCAGFEGTKPSNARAKLYWRLRHPVTLRELGVDLLAGDELAEWLAMTMSDRAMSSTGFVFSAGFLVATGDLFDVKLDLCCHCLDYRPAQWPALLERWSRRWELPPLDLRALLDGRGAVLSYAGFGIDRQGSGRINLYLRGQS